MKKISTTVEAVNNGSDELIVTGKSEWFAFVDGEKGERLGTRYDTVLPGNRLSAMTVKVEGKDTIPQLTDEAIAEAVANWDFPIIKLKNGVVNLYTMNGSLGMTATAEGIILVDPDK